MRPARAAAALLAAGALVAACGGGKGGRDTAGARVPVSTVQASSASGSRPSAPVTTRVEVIRHVASSAGHFDPSAIYAADSPGVVTVISVFGNRLSDPATDPAGLGSGFVLDRGGEIATNAHVVTVGRGSLLRRAREVFVRFADDNQVPARIVGTDPSADIAMVRVDPRGLTLRPLLLGSSRRLVVGSPVAAIGSPFGEAQSISVGIISALNRAIDSLNSFAISGAIQTDAAINHGNSGGPLVDARGRVIGVNAQIQSTGGGGEGVGFAVPIDLARASLSQLRARGTATYAYLGVTSSPLYPQLARRLGIPVDHGAFVQTVAHGSPADRAGLRAGTHSIRFQVSDYRQGGDVITAVGGRPLSQQFDLADAVGRHRPGDRVRLDVYRGARHRVATVTVGSRPSGAPR